MKIVIVSNFMNHHMIHLCDNLSDKLNDNFLFVETEEIDSDRLKLGYHIFERNYIRKLKDVNISVFQKAEVVIFGGLYKELEELRPQDKLTFLYHERIFKSGEWKKFLPTTYYSMSKGHRKLDNPNRYLLCASAFSAADFTHFGLFKNRCLKWGYFPAMSNNKLDNLINRKNKNSIIWVGRNIAWKQLNQAIDAMIILKKNGYNLTLKVIGYGPEDDIIRNKIIDNNMTNEILMLGACDIEKTRKIVESSDIMLVTSNFNEGWGAVVNEGMASACAMVVSYQVGSAGFLMQNNKNGLLYDGTLDDLVENISFLVDNNEVKCRMQIEAFNTIKNSWNHNIAADRLLSFIDTQVMFDDGPISKAEINNNRAMKYLLKRYKNEK